MWTCCFCSTHAAAAIAHRLAVASLFFVPTKLWPPFLLPRFSPKDCNWFGRILTGGKRSEIVAVQDGPLRNSELHTSNTNIMHQHPVQRQQNRLKKKTGDNSSLCCWKTQPKKHCRLMLRAKETKARACHLLSSTLQLRVCRI